jgi:mannose-6-phosphate isomerase-like protein (cupin superfamily)
MERHTEAFPSDLAIDALNEKNVNDRSCVIHLAEAQAHIPGPYGEHATTVLRRGTIDVALSIPTSPVHQTPHPQDEIYLILRGQAIAMHDGKRETCAAGDLVFIAAGIEHQFEDTSEDFAVWRIFYGPGGGENSTRNKS